MAWTWIPDVPYMNNPQISMQAQSSPTLQDAFTSFTWFEELKKKMSEEQKNKEEKEKSKSKTVKMPKLSLGEAWGMVMLFSMPIVLAQLYLLQIVQTALNATFNGTPLP